MKEEILKKVEKFLDMGYRQILIRDEEVYASGGFIDVTDEEIENAAALAFTPNENEKEA